MYKLYYCPAYPIDNLHHGRYHSFDEQLEVINNYVKAYHNNTLCTANLEAFNFLGPNFVKMNFIARDLLTNPIAKPFLITHDFVIVTGDTRYFAAQMHSNIINVACLMTCKEGQQPHNWTEVKDTQELADILGIDALYIMMHVDTWHDAPLEWIEFSTPHTAHHNTNEDVRYTQITNYLQSRPKDWIITQDWLLEDIDWSKFSK